MPKKDAKTKALEKKARTAAKAEKKTKKSTAKASKKSKSATDNAANDSSDDDDPTDLDAVLASYAAQQEQYLAVTESPCPPPSARASATLLPNPQNARELLLFGGEFFDGRTARFFNDLVVYNTHKSAWSVLTSPNSPLPRSGHAWCVHPNSKGVYLFGGEFSSPKQGTFYHYADFWHLSPSTREWTKIEPRGKPPSARSGHRMVGWKGYILLFGGFRDTAGGTTYLADFYAFDTASGVWHNLVPQAGSARPDARSSFSFLPHEAGAVVFGGYSRVKGVVKGKGGGGGKAVERPVVHADVWVARLSFPSSTSSSTPTTTGNTSTLTLRWEKRKRPANAPNPPRAGATMAAHKGRGIAFGGVWDTEGSEEGIESEFFNSLGVWNVERNRIFTLGLRRPRAKKAGEGAAERGGRGARSKAGEEELVARLRELEARDRETGDGGEEKEETTLDGTTQVDDDEERDEAAAVEKPVMWEMPHPRFNAQLAVQDDVCYIYGGTYEKGDKEFTFDEMWAIDLGKLDGCKEIFRRELPDWGVDEEEEEEDEDEEEGQSEEDEEGEEDVGGEAAPTVTNTVAPEDPPLSPTSTVVDADEQQQKDESSLQDTLPHPRPFESLRAFYARTSEAWQALLLEELTEKGDVAGKSIKEVRKGAFERAEEKWWDCREEIQTLEDEQEEAGIGEVVNLAEKQAAGAGTGGAGRRR